MTVWGRRVRGTVLALLLALSLQAAGQRVVAVGDIHGDPDALAVALQHTGVMDDNRHWSGGSTTLVQVGDLVDRGDHARDVLDLMMALEKEAPKSGGQVIALLGNHEFMNLVGDLRYVTPAGFAEYTVQRSARIRRNAYQHYYSWAKQRARQVGFPTEPLSEAEWNAQHPLGFVEQREQFSPGGKYGRWLRQRPAVAQVGDVIFLHGGLDPALDVTAVSDLNQRIRSELRRFDEIFSDLEARGIVLPFFTLQETVESAAAELKAGVSDPQLRARLTELLGYSRWYAFRPDGPLWFRGYSEWPDDHDPAPLATALARSGARHVVVGHTVQTGHRIRERFHGLVFLIDTGMSRFYAGGRPCALEISRGKFTAIYADGQKMLLEEPLPPTPGAGPGPHAGAQ